MFRALKEFFLDMPITATLLAVMLVITAVAIATVCLGLMIPAMIVGVIALFVQGFELK